MDLRVQCDEHVFFLTLPRDACVSSLKRMLYDAIYRDYALEMSPEQQRITLGSVYPEELHDHLLLLCLLPTHRDHLVLHLPIFLTRPVPSTYVSDEDGGTLCLCDVRSYEIPYVEQWARGPYRRIEVDMDHIASESILRSVRRVLPSHGTLQVLHLLSVYGVVPKRDQLRIRRIMNDNPRREVMVLSVYDRVSQTFL